MKNRRLCTFSVTLFTAFAILLSCKARKEQGSVLRESQSNQDIYEQPIPQHKGPLYLFSWGDKELHRKMVFGDNGESPMDTTFHIVRDPWRAAQEKSMAPTLAAGPGLYFSLSWADTISYGNHVLLAKVSPVNGDSFPFPMSSSHARDSFLLRIEEAVLENRGDEPFAANGEDGAKPYVYALNRYSQFSPWLNLVHKPLKEDNIKIEFFWLDDLNINSLANDVMNTLNLNNSADKGFILNASFAVYSSIQSLTNKDKNSLDFTRSFYSSFADEMLLLLEKEGFVQDYTYYSSLISLLQFFYDIKDDDKFSHAEQLLLTKSSDVKLHASYKESIPLINFLLINLKKNDPKQLEIFLEIIKNFSLKKNSDPYVNSQCKIGPIAMAANNSDIKKLIEKYLDTPLDILEWTKETLSNEQKSQMRSYLTDSAYAGYLNGKCVLCDFRSGKYKQFPDLYKEWPAAFSRIFKAIDEPIPE